MDSELNASRTDPIKSLSNMLQETVPEPIPGSESESVDTSGGLRTSGQPAGDRNQQRSEGSRIRSALWRCAVFCTEPFLSRLRDYFTFFVTDLTRSIAALIDLMRSANRRAAATWHIIGALKEEIKGLARREDVENLARQIKALASQSINAHRSTDALLNRNILPFGDTVIARTPDGYLLAPNDDLPLIFDLAEGGSRQTTIFELLDRTLKKDMTFVDVGAHIGIHTLHGARRVGPGGMVIAFEPAPEVFQLLQRSIHLNGLDKMCRCINTAISSAEGMATFHMSRHSAYNSLYPLLDVEEEAAIEVKTASLDSMLQGLQRVDVVKIAAGGAELEVLEGMKRVLVDHRDILLIVEYEVSRFNGLGIKPSEWFSSFFGHGFDAFSIDEQTNRWMQIPEERASQQLSKHVVFARPETSPWMILMQHER